MARPKTVAHEQKAPSYTKIYFIVFALSLFMVFVWSMSLPKGKRQQRVDEVANAQIDQPLIIENPEGRKEDQATDNQRRNAWLEWLEAAQTVASDTKDTEAQAVVQFLRENATLVTPHELGVQFLEKAKGDNWCAVVAMLPGDESKGEKWQFYSNQKNAVAHFLPNERTLIIKSHIPFSSSWKGGVLLHEGYHAYTFIRTPYDWTDIQTYCYKERDTHSFQNRVMGALDKRYTIFLNQEVNRLRAQIKKDGGTVGNDFPNRDNYLKALDDIFGEAQSDLERNTRQTHFWIHACFVLLEQDFKGDIENQKALFLRTLYDQGGILPVQKK